MAHQVTGYPQKEIKVHARMGTWERTELSRATVMSHNTHPFDLLTISRKSSSRTSKNFWRIVSYVTSLSHLYELPAHFQTLHPQALFLVIVPFPFSSVPIVPF